MTAWEEMAGIADDDPGEEEGPSYSVSRREGREGRRRPWEEERAAA